MAMMMMMLGEKQYKFEEILPIYKAVNSETDVGTFADFMEAFKTFDREGQGFIAAAELRHVLTSIGNRAEFSAEQWLCLAPSFPLPNPKITHQSCSTQGLVFHSAICLHPRINLAINHWLVSRKCQSPIMSLVNLSFTCAQPGNLAEDFFWSVLRGHCLLPVLRRDNHHVGGISYLV